MCTPEEIRATILSLYEKTPVEHRHIIQKAVDEIKLKYESETDIYHEILSYPSIKCKYSTDLNEFIHKIEASIVLYIPEINEYILFEDLISYLRFLQQVNMKRFEEDKKGEFIKYQLISVSSNRKFILAYNKNADEESINRIQQSIKDILNVESSVTYNENWDKYQITIEKFINNENENISLYKDLSAFLYNDKSNKYKIEKPPVEYHPLGEIEYILARLYLDDDKLNDPLYLNKKLFNIIVNININGNNNSVTVNNDASTYKKDPIYDYVRSNPPNDKQLKEEYYNQFNEYCKNNKIKFSKLRLNAALRECGYQLSHSVNKYYFTRQTL